MEAWQQAPDLPPHDLADIEVRTREVGRHIVSHLDDDRPSVFHRRWWDDQLMNLAMKDESLKLQLFRFVDVLPMLHSPDAVVEHLQEYLDEVRGKLSQVSGIAVIARASSNEYRKTTKAPQQIARELGADYLLTATVRWEKAGGGPSRVRVSPELIRVDPGAAPTTKWQQPFDASLTDVFQVQADIAT